MNRTFSTPAIILSIKPLGENNSSVTILTPERGILHTVLYGGPKSKMKSLVMQWNSGIIYLYENPEKNQIKISDFDVKNEHISFRNSLYKNFAASLAAELAIKTSCAGSYEECFLYTSGFLDGMDLCDEDQSKVGLIRYLWRFIELLGIQPVTDECSECGKNFVTEFAPNLEYHYNGIENTFICNDCCPKEINSYYLPAKAEAVRYLDGISKLSPGEARKLKIDLTSYEQLRNIIFFIIQNNVNTKLLTIDTGVGIL